ncbi:2-nitropropane dioxygenase, partial [Mycena olivaceomarginata]
GVDLICTQASEGGGYTGDIPGSILIPACVDAVKGHKSPLTGKPVYIVGRGLAANRMWGAEAVVRVGTRFVAAEEASAPKKHKELIVSAGFEDAVTTLIFTGQPLRVRRTDYVDNWRVLLLPFLSFSPPSLCAPRSSLCRNNNRQPEIKELTGKGVLPHEVELQKHPEISVETRPWLMGRVSSLINAGQSTSTPRPSFSLVGSTMSFRCP